MNKTETLIESLIRRGQTLSVMESCTGGAFASEITNYSRSSSVFKRGYIAYSTEAKIEFGVPEEVIGKFTIYSPEVAMEMARCASELADSTYGVGITGQIDGYDPDNLGGNPDKVDVSIYSSVKNAYKNYSLDLKDSKVRKIKKDEIVDHIINELLRLLNKDSLNFSYLPDDIIILPHPNPDVDSIISGYLLEKLLKDADKNAKFIIPDKTISEESYNMCLKYGIDAKKYKGEVPPGANLFLVDHYSTNEEGKLIGIIDHHPTASKIEIPIYMNSESCSTALSIYRLNPHIFDRSDIKLVALASIVDTTCFKSSKATPANEEYIKVLCEQHKLDYDALYREGLGLTDLENFNTAVINGLKEYNFNGYHLKSSYIQVDKINQRVVDLFTEGCKELLIEEKLYMWVFLVHDMTLFKTTAYLITEDKTRVVEYDSIASRGNTIMPSIERRLLEK